MIEVWKTEYRKVKDLIPYERNPRTISKERFEKLKQRIQSQGFRVPPSLDNKGVILSGHQRIRAMIDMGCGDVEVPVSIPQRKLTQKEIKEIVASDNLSWGDWDMGILSSDYGLEELIEYGFDPKELGLKDNNYFEHNKELNENDINTKNKCPKCGFKF